MKRFLPLVTAILLSSLLLHAAAYPQSNARIEAEQLFVEAQKALAKGDYETAEQLLKRSLQKDESFTSAIWQLSQIYEKDGKLEYARQLLLRGLQQEPDASWAREKLTQLERVLTSKLLFEAESFMSRGEYDKAIPKLSLFLGIKPYDPVPLIQLARCHLALGNLKTAKDYLGQAAHRDPSNHEIAALQSEIESRLERTSVSSVLRQAREILANYTPENEQEAREALEKVLALDPENAWARDKLGELDLLATEEHVQETGEKAIEKGIEAVKDLKGPFTAVGNFLAGHITALVLAVVAVLLVFDIRRRTEQRSYPLQGNLSLIPLLDVVSLLNSNLKTGRLVVVADDTRGEIFFEKGEIIHARWKNNDGKKAFNLLMKCGSGTYFFNNHLPSIRHTISEPLSLLLLSLKSTEEPPTTTKQVETEEPASV